MIYKWLFSKGGAQKQKLFHQNITFVKIKEPCGTETFSWKKSSP